MRTLDVAVILVYLALTMGMGFWFMRRNRDADAYFKGGGRLPWWVVSLSIYATMFSALTFISGPAMSYAEDLSYFVISFGIPIMALVVVRWYLPLFRRLNLTSAYEYLEVRFNLPCRLFASAAFILFMIARSGIVAYLPALAISAVTGVDINLSILCVMLVTIVYCTVGGVAAVVWCDFFQTLLLFGSTVLILGWAVLGTDGGLSGFIATGMEHHKFRLLNFALDWSEPCFWVVFVGGLVANLATYTSDQSVVQRYMTTSDEKGAAKSIYVNGVLSIVSAFVFGVIGVAIWTYYHSRAGALPPGTKPDAVIPIFIARELPNGLSGAVFAAIAAATMSTLSANFNSAASAITTDFYRRLALKRAGAPADGRRILRVAKLSTVAMGVVATLFALWLANADIRNIYVEFQRFLGILTGGLGSLFFMGFFMKRVNGFGATCGLVANYAVCVTLDLIPWAGKPHMFLYGFFGMATCLIVAPVASLLKGNKN